jgi:D-arabinose 1-dehydrogenase-like Zn-dependent alcohol dehydrogenase
MHYREYEIVGCRFVTKAELLQIIKLVERGKITPVVTKTYPFEQANEALKSLSEQRSLGRTVLTS